MGGIDVPAFWAEWAMEYRAGWEVGQADKKGGSRASRTPRFSGPYAARRGAAFRAGRDDCMKARGLVKTTQTDGRLKKLAKAGIYTPPKHVTKEGE